MTYEVSTQLYLPVFTDDTTPSFVLLPEDQREIRVKFMYITHVSYLTYFTIPVLLHIFIILVNFLYFLSSLFIFCQCAVMVNKSNPKLHLTDDQINVDKNKLVIIMLNITITSLHKRVSPLRSRNYYINVIM